MKFTIAVSWKSSSMNKLNNPSTEGEMSDSHSVIKSYCLSCVFRHQPASVWSILTVNYHWDMIGLV